MKNIMMLISLCSAYSLFAAAPTATITEFRRFGKNVVITYNLSGDAVVTADILSNGNSIGVQYLSNMSGDVNRAVKGGTGKKIIWPFKDTEVPKVKLEAARAKVTAWALDSTPDYCVIDLSTKSNVNYYVSAEAVPLGVTNDIYKTTKLVLRRVHAKGVQFRMGTAANMTYYNSLEIPHRVTFTNDYYLGIYPFTQKQVKLCWPNYPWTPQPADRADSDMRPSNKFGNYGILRGDVMLSPDSHKTRQDSNNGVFRRCTDLTGVLVDLPTEQQWEFACRAGDDVSYFENDIAANIGKYAWHSGNVPDQYPQAVGQKEPNAWGFYDMLGNVLEACLDYYYTGTTTYSDGSDVLESCGYISGTEERSRECVYRGGCYLSTSSHRYAARDKYWRSESGTQHGYRLWAPVQAYVKEN